MSRRLSWLPHLRTGAPIRRRAAAGRAETAARALPGWDAMKSRQRSQGWNLIDFVVAAGVSLAAAMLFFPAVSNSRYQAQLAACQNNLRMFGIALPIGPTETRANCPTFHPGQDRRGRFLRAAADGRWTGQSTAVFSAPVRRWRFSGLRSPFPRSTPSSELKGAKLIALQRRMGGSYCYGWDISNKASTRPTRCRADPLSPSCPTIRRWREPARCRMSIHAGRGLSVLFEDGHVRFFVINPEARLRPTEWQTRNLAAGRNCSSATGDRGSRVSLGRRRAGAQLGPPHSGRGAIGRRATCSWKRWNSSSPDLRARGVGGVATFLQGTPGRRFGRSARAWDQTYSRPVTAAKSRAPSLWPTAGTADEPLTLPQSAYLANFCGCRLSGGSSLLM